MQCTVNINNTTSSIVILCTTVVQYLYSYIDCRGLLLSKILSKSFRVKVYLSVVDLTIF